MSGDARIRMPKDLNKIDGNDLGELIWWSNHLAVFPEQLLSIIGKVGKSSEKIRKYIRLNQKSGIKLI